jgi:hypothetical protein
MPYSGRVKDTLGIKMGRNVMISRKAKKLAPATEQLQALTPAELTEVSGGGDGGGDDWGWGGGGGDDDWWGWHHHHHHHRHWYW